MFQNRVKLRGLAAAGLITQPGIVHGVFGTVAPFCFFLGAPSAGGQLAGLFFQRAGPFVVAHAPALKVAGDALQVFTRAGGAVGLEMIRAALPKRLIGFEQAGQLIAVSGGIVV